MIIDYAVWLAVGALVVIGVIYSVHLYLKYRGRPKKVLKVEPDKCCFCGKEENTNFFCKPCCRRLVWRYAAILSGIGCIPVAVLAGFLIHAFTGGDLGDSVGSAAFVAVITYLVILSSYSTVYSRVGVDILSILAAIVLLPLILIGLPISFGMKIGPDPSKTSFTFREEWWRFRLLVRQLRGRVKSAP